MKVAIYIRVSSEEQVKEGFSIPAQRHKLMSYAELQEWDIFDIYIDEGWSGAKLERPELTRLRNDMKEGKFDGVLVWKVDRFFRNVFHLSAILHEMEQYKVSFKSMTESFDTSTPSGKAMLQMMAVFAEWERETIRERIVNALSERARQGLHHGMTPYGYNRRQDGVLVPDEGKAEVIKTIFEMRAKGSPHQKITNYIVKKWGLEFLGFETKEQVQWFILRTLDNPTYAGYVLHRGDPLPGEHKPIIDQTTYHLVQANKGSRSDEHFYIFKGLLYCGECGSRLRSKSRKDRGERIYYYFCPKSKVNTWTNLSGDYCKGRQIREHLAISHVRSSLKKLMLEIDSSILESEIKNEDKQDDSQEELIQIDKRISELRKKKNRYFMMFEEDPEFEQEAKDRIKEITKDITELEMLKQEKEAAQQKATSEELDIDTLKNILSKLDELINKSDRENLRELFLLLFEKIIVHAVHPLVPGQPGSYVEPIIIQDTL